MPWFPAVLPALAAADGGGRINKRRAGLPRLLHKLFIKVLRLRPVSSTAEAEFYGYQTAAGDEEECCYYYSYGGAGASWASVLSSIPEEDDDSSEDDGDTPDVAPGHPAVLRKAKSERFVVGPTPDAATVVRVEVLL